MDPILAVIILMVLSQLIPLGALALRLHSHTRYQDRRQHTLVTLASRLPPNMLVELDDVHGDGSQLRLRIDTDNATLASEREQRNARA